MTDQLAATRPSPGLLTRILTPIVTGSATRLLDWQPRGSIDLTLPGGQRRRFGVPAAGGENAELVLNDYRVIPQSFRRGALGFAEAYIDGHIDTPDLVKVFRFFVQNRQRLDRSGRGLFRVRRGDRKAHARRRNSRAGSRRNIAEHYDLGNDFYSHWLDADFNYSSGYYARGTESLADAQIAKLDLIAELLDLTPGHRVLEIGCGWGALAARLADAHGAHVTGITLSREQLAHAEARVGAEGLSDHVEFRFQDYRDTTGAYDRVVSVEMIEAVGEDNWPSYFRILGDRLESGGAAVIQAITIDERHYERYRRSADFIQRHIFPGGMLPTRTIIAEQAAAAGLRLERDVRFGTSYARTLSAWRERFEAAWPEIERLGFDARFRRKWRYYFAYCEAGFLEGVIDVGAYRLVKA